MSKHSRPMRMALGATVGLGLLLGTACGGGAGNDKPVQAASAQPAADAAPAEPTTTEAPAPTVPATVAPTTTARPAASARAATQATTATPAQSASTAATSPPATAAPVTAAPAVTVPSRPNPSTPEVLGAIAQFKTRVPLFSPSEAQARQFGDMVCDAFDGGQTYSQVKATALAQVAAVPFITITSADADFILRIAVKLFCPAYSSKLP